MKLRSLFAAVIVSSTPFVANAAPANAGISYTYGEASYQAWTDSKYDAHNWGLKGSYQVGDQFYITAEDDYLTNKKIGGSGRSGGVGFFAPLDDNLHLYGQLSLADSHDGLRPVLEGGARMALNNELEVRGALRFVSDAYLTPKKEDELFIHLEGLYKLDSRIGVVGGLAVPTEADGVVLNLGARFSF